MLPTLFGQSTLCHIIHEWVAQKCFSQGPTMQDAWILALVRQPLGDSQSVRPTRLLDCVRIRIYAGSRDSQAGCSTLHKNDNVGKLPCPRIAVTICLLHWTCPSQTICIALQCARRSWHSTRNSSEFSPQKSQSSQATQTSTIFDPLITLCFVVKSGAAKELH